jgi:hypothetical protein
MLRSLRTTCMASATGALGPSPRAGHPRFTTSAWAALLRCRQLLGPGVKSLIELRAYMPDVARAGIWEHFPVHHGQLKGPAKLHRRGTAGISATYFMDNCCLLIDVPNQGRREGRGCVFRCARSTEKIQITLTIRHPITASATNKAALSASDNGDRSHCRALRDCWSVCSHLRQAAGERIEDCLIDLWICSHNLVELSPTQLGNR